MNDRPSDNLSELKERAEAFLRNAPSHSVPLKIKQETDPAHEKRRARKWWQRILASLMILQLLFMDGILVFVGLGYLDLGQPVLSVFITGIFGQVAGFVYIVLKFYFRD